MNKLRLAILALALGGTHACGSVHAASLAQPCLAHPPTTHHHAHAKPEPLQSCAAPVVPMCFRDVPEPDIEPMPNVRPYYINVPVADDGTQGDGPYIETAGTLGAQVIYDAPIGGGAIPPRASAPTARAPEISASGAGAALTLLLGGIAILRGAKRT